MSDSISRQEAINAIPQTSVDLFENCRNCELLDRAQVVAILESLPSAEPKKETVLCALADRTCPFQGKEYAWCLTCPHISEEDRNLIKRAIEPKTGEWVLDPNGMDWNIPAWRCSECGFVANYIGVEAKGFGNNPMNWAGSKFCPQCGARITGYER